MLAELFLYKYRLPVVAKTLRRYDVFALQLKLSVTLLDPLGTLAVTVCNPFPTLSVSWKVRLPAFCAYTRTESMVQLARALKISYCADCFQSPEPLLLL